MSVIVISGQQIADALYYANKFYNGAETKTAPAMCTTLAKMGKDSIHDFFCRLYVWNHLSYHVLHNEEEKFDRAGCERWYNQVILLGRETNLFQFIQTLRFLNYNIEDYNIVAAADESEYYDGIIDREQLKSDMNLLQTITNEICQKFIEIHLELVGAQWCY